MRLREIFLREFLAKTSYYRFSGYVREFQVDPKYGKNCFTEGVSFSGIREIMRADSEMRLLLMKQLSAIEVAVRALIAHEYGRNYGEKAFYLDTGFYRQSDNTEEGKPLEIARGIALDLSRSKSGIVSRYVDKSVIGDEFESKVKRYAGVPIWVAVEVVSPGKVSNMFSYAKDFEPAKTAAGFLGVQWDPLKEVVHSLSVLKNLCAHHRQFWNRRMGFNVPSGRNLSRETLSFCQQAPTGTCL